MDSQNNRLVDSFLRGNRRRTALRKPRQGNHSSAWGESELWIALQENQLLSTEDRLELGSKITSLVEENRTGTVSRNAYIRQSAKLAHQIMTQRSVSRERRRKAA